MRKFNNYITRIVIMSASGCLLIFFAGRYKPPLSSHISATSINASSDIETISGTSAYFVSRATSQWNDILHQASLLISGFSNKYRIEEDEEYVPSVLRYNLVNLFPEENKRGDSIPANLNSEIQSPADFADLLLEPIYKKLKLPVKPNVRNSYGGQLYEKLSKKDAEWTSGLYQWIQATPVRAAAMQNLSSSTVIGGYNPVNPLHKPEDPSSWVIPSWKNVNINFYDGDGKSIELYSNAQAIASMVSVNTYYTDWRNVESFEAYIEKLWSASHSYSAKISSVYYCDGCVDPSVPVANADKSTAELAKADTEAFDASQQGTQTGTEAAKPVTTQAEPVTTQVEATATQAALANAASMSPTAGSDISAAQEASAAQEVSGAESAAVSLENNIAETQALPNTTQSDLDIIKADVGPAGPASDIGQTEGQIAGFPAGESSGESTANIEIVSNGPAADAAATSAAATQTIAAAGVSVDSSIVETIKAPEILLNAEGKFCPGHVDLDISARIIGLSEKKNLFTVDNTVSNGKEVKAWSPYMKAYVHQLFSQDWKEEYGLSITELGIGKPLTSNEISNYLDSLPPDTSADRRAVVTYALNSVGKIPYYYGGKPRTTGYEDNNFSTLTRPDQKGRVLSGLDCSGWVNWIYWSAIGERPTALGTSGLIHEGRSVRREELKPGDIIVKPGINSHVVMFLNWSANGAITCIHETGGSTSNVTVSTLDVRWPYYRALLD